MLALCLFFAVSAKSQLLAAGEDFKTYYSKGIYYVNLYSKNPAPQLLSNAKEAFEKALELEPKNKDVYIYLAITAEFAGRVSEAEKHYKQAIELDKNNFVAYNNLGNVFIKQKRNDEALAAYDTAIKIKPDNYSPVLGKANAYDNMGRTEDALIEYKKAAELSPDNCIVYTEMGLCYANSKNYKSALEAYDKALSLQPNYAKAVYERISVLNELKEYSKALDAAEDAIERFPHFLDGYFYKTGILIVGFNKQKEAIKFLNENAARLSQHKNFYYYMGMAYMDLGNNKKCVENYTKAINLEKNVTYYINRSACLSKMGKDEEAFKDYQQITALTPDNAPVYYNMAEVQLFKGNTDDALKYLQTFLSKVVRPSMPAADYKAWSKKIKKYKKQPTAGEIQKIIDTLNKI